jgi:hypothetical protein
MAQVRGSTAIESGSEALRTTAGAVTVAEVIVVSLLRVTSLLGEKLKKPPIPPAPHRGGG